MRYEEFFEEWEKLDTKQRQEFIGKLKTRWEFAMIDQDLYFRTLHQIVGDLAGEINFVEENGEDHLSVMKAIHPDLLIPYIKWVKNGLKEKEPADMLSNHHPLYHAVACIDKVNMTKEEKAKSIALMEELEGLTYIQIYGEDIPTI